MLPTDTQKQTAYAFAKEKGLHSIQDCARQLATHYVDDVEPVHGARIEVEEFAWERAVVDGEEHDHTWVRRTSRCGRRPSPWRARARGDRSGSSVG